MWTKTTSKIKKLSLKTKEEQSNQLRETLEAKENVKSEPRERQVEKDEDGIVFHRRTEGQRVERLPSVLKNCEQEEAIAETASKLR